MNQNQAIVTAVIRIMGGLSLFYLVGTIFFTPTIEFSPTHLAGLTSDPDAGIKAIDFAAGTVVHVYRFGYVAIVFCCLLIVFSKQVAIWITPGIKES